MRLGKQDDTRVIVTIKTARRAKPGEKASNGKAFKPNAMIYETFESLDVFEASPEEVTKGVVNGLQSAARSGK